MFYSRLGSVIHPLAISARQCLIKRPQKSTVNMIFRKMRLERPSSSNSIKRRRRTVWESVKVLAKDSPILIPLAFILMFISSGILLWTNKYYSDYIIGAFHTFPEPVAKQLRKAIFYTNVDLKPSLALKYYKEAVRIGEELGIDRFSDEMMGIKVQIALLFEKCEKYSKAIEVLEAVRSDNLKWLEVVGFREGWEARRNKVLRKTVQISVKLGDLYSNIHVLEQGLAEERLTWAVEETLREQQRRLKEGIKEDEGSWFDEDEIGSQFETLAHMHEEKNRHYLSAPLFLQALNLSPPKSCHTVVLMNNLAASLVQQVPTALNTAVPDARDSLITNATKFAEKAIALAGKIQPPERNEECDTGCTVAIFNLAEIAEMRGDLINARKKYEEAAEMAKSIGFKVGLKKSRTALKRIEKQIEENRSKATNVA
ncbi:TPR repeat-containing protein P27G11.02 [Golovinomyces cichoracearum]|uniref:TPR repeat-containing protein P27G11.02 n=1 Tax=Golovinomyces cichoracearum TaxID=62708 RepID=A0A420IFJ6_9PEZI|nr:TPR repeat-containing protein P27G11.02 [Golovinomyces cichoracearum]